MDQQQGVGWLHRRAGLGLHPDDLAAAVARGANNELVTLSTAPTDPVDPWAGLALDPQDGGRAEAVLAWMGALRSSTQPFHDRRTLLLHGWLVSALDKVTAPELMVEQIRLFMAIGGDSFPDLLRGITTNRAMLVYLDGQTSTAEAPNENYGRELLELFALGVGYYTEDDVQSAARALTGWVVRRQFDEARFVPRRHDDTPQTLLAAYRVADSPVNVLTPLMVYLPFMVTVAQRYKKDAGIGTIIALMVPYTVWVLAAWVVLYVAWFLLGIPWGPGYPVGL